MAEYDLTVTDDLLKNIKKTLRITTKVYDDDIKETIQEGMAEIQTIVGLLDFSNDNDLVSIKAYSLLKTYCFYSWHDMKPVFKNDNKNDLLELQMSNAIAQRRNKHANKKE